MSQYLTFEEYEDMGGSTLTIDNADRYLTAASLRIDSLTFNRIGAFGFDSLTEFQKGIIRQCVKDQADFEWDNQDVIESVVSAYGINGVDVQFGSGMGIKVVDGVAIKRSVADRLKQTGLMCRSLRW